MRRLLTATMLAWMVALLAAPTVSAQSERATQLVVPYGPGNGLDALAREFAHVLQAQGDTVVVYNREGAGGIVGTSYAAHASTDGRSVLFTAHPPFATAPFVAKSAGYDPLTSFIPVARVGSVPLVVIAAANLPFKTFQEMLLYAKANPTKANYASSGVGSPGQLYTELIKKATGSPLQEVPYKSTAQGLTDVIAGNVLVSLVSYPAAAANIKSGALRLLAVGSTQRMKEYPDVPTLAEAIGQPGFEAGVWYGFFLPAGASADAVHKLYASVATAYTSPEVQTMMERASITPHLLAPAEFSRALRADVDAARKLLGNAQLIEPK